MDASAFASLVLLNSALFGLAGGMLAYYVYQPPEGKSFDESEDVPIAALIETTHVFHPVTAGIFAALIGGVLGMLMEFFIITNMPKKRKIFSGFALLGAIIISIVIFDMKKKYENLIHQVGDILYPHAVASTPRIIKSLSRYINAKIDNDNKAVELKGV